MILFKYKNIVIIDGFAIRRENCSTSSPRWNISPTKDSANKENVSEYIKTIYSFHFNFDFILCAEHKEHLEKFLLSKSINFFIRNWCR